MTTYQGHLADGSSVQKHSAGGAYPYVLQLRDNCNGASFCWEMIGPGIETALRFGSSAEWDAAVRRILAVRASADAWSFELEQLCLVAGQKQAAMVHACRDWVRPAEWLYMGPARRVGVLLWLGKARNTLRLPMVQVPAFAQLAAAAV